MRKIIYSIILITLSFTFINCGDRSANLYPNDDGKQANYPIWAGQGEAISVDKRKDYWEVKLKWREVVTNQNNDNKDNIIGYKVTRGSQKTIIGIVPKEDVHPENGVNYYIFVDRQTSGFSDGEQIQYYITAFDPYRDGLFSSSQTAVFTSNMSNAPKEPSNLQYIVDDSKIVLSWDEPAETADGNLLNDLYEYYIERRTGSSIDYEYIAKIPKGMSIFSDSSVNKNITYAYRIWSYSANETKSINSLQSGDIKVTDVEKKVKPMIPSNLSLTTTNQDGKTGYRITFDKPTHDEEGSILYNLKGYLIYRAEESYQNDYKLIKMIKDLNYYTDYNVELNKTYYYKLKAYTTDGMLSEFSNYVSSLSSQKIPPIPTGVRAYFDVNGQVNIAWNNMGTYSYNLYRSLRENGLYTPVAGGLSNNIYTYTENISDLEYIYYKVTSVDGGFESEYSFPVQVQMGKRVTEIDLAGIQMHPTGDVRQGVYNAVLNQVPTKDLNYYMEVINFPLLLNHKFMYFDTVGPNDNTNDAGGKAGVPDAYEDRFSFAVKLAGPARYTAYLSFVRNRNGGRYELISNNSSWFSFDPSSGPLVDFYSDSSSRKIEKVVMNSNLQVSNGYTDFVFSFVCVGKTAQSSGYVAYPEKLIFVYIADN